MSKKRISITIWAVSLLSIFWIVSAQAQESGWSEPFRLSSEAGKTSEGYLAADPYGYVHLFWIETLFEDQSNVIKYARFNGGTWTNPNDIYITNSNITNVSPFVDQYGTLHIAWAQGLNGPAYYTHAPANNAQSAQNWAQPVRIAIPAGFVRLLIDSKGVYHILYINRGVDVGVYYVRSEDNGTTWSEPVWLDADIPPDHTPQSLSFTLDDNDGLQAVWNYGALNVETRDSGWIRYAHSLDGGDTWSFPFTIDKYIEGGDHNPNNAGPVMAVTGSDIHVIWAAGEQPYRYHRYSTDAGETWSVPKHIFGELHGQAGDGFAIDGAGRVHFFTQIRYPLGIYHAYWDKNQWTPPSLVYLIAQEGEAIGDRIHAHATFPIVRAGNQLILTFTDGPADPNRRLFAMYLTLDDLSQLELVPTPVPTATPFPLPSSTQRPPTPMPTPTATPLILDREAQPVGDISRPDLMIWMALASNLLLFVCIVVIQLMNKPKH